MARVDIKAGGTGGTVADGKFDNGPYPKENFRRGKFKMC